MVARFVAGVAAGVVWALLAGYARRLAPPGSQGRAIAIVMAGIPLALSLGIPAGTFLGGLLGWRSAFGVMSAIAVVLLAWIAAAVPDQPGRTSGRVPVLRTLAVPGVVPVLAVTLVFVLAHTVLYTYVAAFLGHAGMGDAVDVVLLVFGVASMAGIWVVGARIDRALRTLTVLSTILVAVAATILATAASSPAPVYAAVALWGLGWGGVPTLLQTAAGNAGGEAADNAQAMLVTLWNAAMAAGGVLGGVLLDAAGPASFPWTLLGAPAAGARRGARRAAARVPGAILNGRRARAGSRPGPPALFSSGRRWPAAVPRWRCHPTAPRRTPRRAPATSRSRPWPTPSRACRSSTTASRTSRTPYRRSCRWPGRSS